jgi:predicted PurR-regulated permease PerM
MNSVNDSLKGIKGVITVFGVLALTIVLILAQKDIIHIFMLYLTSILLAILLDGVSQYIERFTHFSHSAILITVILILLGLLFVMGLLMGPVLIKQIPLLIKSIPGAINSLRSIIASTPWGNQLLPVLKLETFLPLGMNLIRSVEEIFTVSLQAISEIVFIILMATFLAFNPKIYIESLIRLFKPSKREQIRFLLKVIASIIRKWFVGRLYAMMLIGTLTFISLAILGMQLAFVLGIIAGLLAVIPFIGAILSIIPAVLVALATHPIQALWVIVIFIGAHLVEDIVAPLIQQKITSVPPAVLISGQIFLTFSAGFLGLILAEPICIVAVIVVQVIYIKGILGETVQILGEKKS